MIEAHISAPHEDVVVMTTVSVSRNYSDLPFPCTQDAQDALDAVHRVINRLDKTPLIGDFDMKSVDILDENERGSLVEDNFLLGGASDARSTVLIASDKLSSVTVNAEDHIRIQCTLPGLNIEKALERVQTLETAICDGMPIAYDTRWGYLTSRPANVGTGLNIKVLLHLPATLSEYQFPYFRLAQKLLGESRHTLTSVYGNKIFTGSFVMLGSTETIGITECELACSVNATSEKLIEGERERRQKLITTDNDLLCDKTMRAVGILSNARLLDFNEFTALYSQLRLAAAEKILSVSVADVDRMMKRVRPFTLSAAAGETLSERDSHLFRAKKVRGYMSALINEKS